MTINFFSNTQRINKKLQTLICLKNILDLKYLVLWQKKLYETKDKKKNNDLVELITVKWSNLKDEIEKNFKDRKETEKPGKILEIVEEILIFSREN